MNVQKFCCFERIRLREFTAEAEIDFNHMFKVLMQRIRQDRWRFM